MDKGRLLTGAINNINLPHISSFFHVWFYSQSRVSNMLMVKVKILI